MDGRTDRLTRSRAARRLGLTLQQLTREGRTLVVTTHDDDLARDFASRVIVLADGQVVEEGDPSRVLTNPFHPATRALLAGAWGESASRRQSSDSTPGHLKAD
jgi:putative phosphonate transport system ATP-binding protein